MNALPQPQPIPTPAAQDLDGMRMGHASSTSVAKELLLALAIQPDQRFWICTSTPSEADGIKRFGELDDKIQAGLASEKEKGMYSFLCGNATFPEDSTLSGLAEKWVQFVSFGGPQLNSLEKIDLALGLGKKLFGDTPHAVMYAANCFMITTKEDKGQLGIELAMRYGELPKL